ncbi:MAG: porin [Gammaproteobacteria bacterium]
MNKKLIALAVAGAMATPAAMADVSVYGQIHLSANMYSSGYGENDTADGANHKTLGLSSNVSRIGVKGEEKLNNGWTAWFKGDWFVDWSNSRTMWKADDTKAGFKGDWGVLSLGRQAGPLKVLGRKTDLFGNTIGDTRAITSEALTDARFAQSVAYVTPTMSGFTGIVAYTAGTDTGGEGVSPPVKKANAWTLAALYGNGPLFVGFAYEHLNKELIQQLIGTAGTADAAYKDWRLAGSYKIGDLKLLAHVGQGKAFTLNSGGTTRGTKRTVWGIGASYKMGNNVLKAQYAAAGKCKGCATESSTKSSLWAIGVDHIMSKRVKVYALYAKMKNDSNAAATLGGHSGFGGQVAINDGVDPGAFSIGTVIKF